METSNPYGKCYPRKVLILIIMEDTHGDQKEDGTKGFMGLNPYYNGRYSWRVREWYSKPMVRFVLILIIMEDTHGVKGVHQIKNYERS